ncbi:MAG: three-Cys-motif partner protein TcmP [Alphaproteobacteria bacterium]|nr:three-Cys-motif partner protein TcmP [Alphaproteobacteria bacterium]
MTSYKQDGTVGPWAHEKLDCLGKYLAAYTTVLRKRSWCEGYFYIDAFAGAGKAPLRKEQAGTPAERQVQQAIFEDLVQSADDNDKSTYVEGSPYVALDIPHPFTRYYFIDLNSELTSKLNSIADEYGDTRDIRILPADANHAITENILGDTSINWRKNRAVIFLDPFGMQVKWDTIAKIATTNAIEIIVNLPVGMAIQRLLARSGEISEARRNTLNEYFGTDEWENIVYEQSTDLFGDRVDKVENSGHRLARWYQGRLKEAFGYASPARLIRNSQRGHLYYLLWAGPNKTGAKIATHVLSQGEAID